MNQNKFSGKIREAALALTLYIAFLCRALEPAHEILFFEEGEDGLKILTSFWFLILRILYTSPISLEKVETLRCLAWAHFCYVLSQ
jgi:hypothetical protein